MYPALVICDLEEVMTLDELRLEIDDIDSAIRELFIARMRVAEQIAETKRNAGMPIFQPGREAELIEKRSEAVPEELKEHYKKFLQSVMDISKERQKEVY